MSLPEVWTMYLLKVCESLKSDSIILLSTPSKKYHIISEYNLLETLLLLSSNKPKKLVLLL
jgi:hypothetical protein